MKLFLPAMAATLATLAISALPAAAQTTPATGPYSVQKIAKVGGEGGFDYVYADSNGRKLYIARSGSTPRVTVFNLDTLEPAAVFSEISARGAAVDTLSHHGFASSKPVAMWDTKTMTLIKTIPVDGGPDGILDDPFNHHVYIFSHSAPNATVIDAADGSVLGTIDLGGAPEQAQTDGKGHVYVDIEDKDSVAVVDARTMKVTATYSLNGKGGGPGGLALDAKNHVLFVACADPQVMVMLDADTGKYLADLPIGNGIDGAAFNPNTMECFSSQGDGTLTVIKEKSPTSFVVEQTVTTMPGAKTLTLDSKTNKILLITAEYAAPTPPPATPVTTPSTMASPSTTTTPPAVTPPTTAPPAAPRRRGGRRQMVPGSFSILVVGK